jgi:hypothetical protein
METLSTRSMHVFVAGSLALLGFRAVVWIPHTIISSRSVMLSAGVMATSLALPIAIALLVGNPRAVLWAKIYLWTDLLGATAMICFSVLGKLVTSVIGPPLDMNDVSALLTSLVILLLLRWSRSKRFSNVERLT